jgi:hypothetical protein
MQTYIKIENNNNNILLLFILLQPVVRLLAGRTKDFMNPNLHSTFQQVLLYASKPLEVIENPTQEELKNASLTETQYYAICGLAFEHVSANVTIVNGRVCTCKFGQKGCNVHNYCPEIGLDTFRFRLHRHVVEDPQIIG